MGAVHGFEFGAQAWPTLAFPLGIPSTVQVTFAFGVPVTVAVKSWPVPAGTIAEEGDTVTTIDGLFTIATVAEALCVPAIALMVTGFVEGTAAGAVYVAEPPVGISVPSAGFPPAIPSTPHVTVVPGAMQSDAEKFCVAPAARLTIAGDTVFATEHEIVTLAVAVFDGSATLVAVTETTEGAGGIVGAVYVTASGPLTLNVPMVRFPPLRPLTVQITAELALPAPLTVAAKLATMPGATFAEFGVTLTVMPL